MITLIIIVFLLFAMLPEAEGGYSGGQQSSLHQFVWIGPCDYEVSIDPVAADPRVSDEEFLRHYGIIK